MCQPRKKNTPRRWQCVQRHCTMQGARQSERENASTRARDRVWGRGGEKDTQEDAGGGALTNASLLSKPPEMLAFYFPVYLSDRRYYKYISVQCESYIPRKYKYLLLQMRKIKIGRAYQLAFLSLEQNAWPLQFKGGCIYLLHYFSTCLAGSRAEAPWWKGTVEQSYSLHSSWEAVYRGRALAKMRAPGDPPPPLGPHLLTALSAVNVTRVTHRWTRHSRVPITSPGISHSSQVDSED